MRPPRGARNIRGVAKATCAQRARNILALPSTKTKKWKIGAKVWKKQK